MLPEISARDPSAPRRAALRKAIFAVSIGNAMEWFDFIIFGHFAIVISTLFFPTGDPASALLLSLATFGAGFVARPVGAIVLGNYADKRGRRSALVITIAVMTIGTAVIALAPTYQAIGPAAPFIILIGRLLQGFSSGGEFGSSTALLAEQNPARRGYLASWQFAGQAFAAVLATSLAAILSVALSPADLNSWGWRIPFLIGIFIGPLAFYIRRSVPDGREFNLAPTLTSPLRTVVLSQKLRTVTALGLVVLITVSIYTLVFTSAFAVRYLGFAPRDVFLASLLAGLAQTAIVPVAGALSDRWGRLPVAGVGAVAIAIFAIPLMTQLVSNPTFFYLLLYQCGIGAFAAIYAGPLAAMMSELFPTQVRTTGLSISYALAVALFGGFAPFINAVIVDTTGVQTSAVYYLEFSAVISLMTLMIARRLGIR